MSVKRGREKHPLCRFAVEDNAANEAPSCRRATNNTRSSKYLNIG